MRRKILKKYAIIFILSLITTQVMAQDEDCKQWEVLIDVGYQFRDTPYNEGYSYKDNDLTFELGTGYRFSKLFYLGFNAGCYNPIINNDISIPLALNGRFYIPKYVGGICPFFDVKMGYLLNTSREMIAFVYDNNNNNMYSTMVKEPNYAMFKLAYGFDFPIDNAVDFMVSAGWAHHMPFRKNFQKHDYFTLNIGLRFH